MIRWIFAFLFIVLVSTKPAIASNESTEDISILNADTFVITKVLTSDKKIIQLFKIENNEINLLDVIEVKKKMKGFTPLFEFRHLEIEEKN